MFRLQRPGGTDSFGREARPYVRDFKRADLESMRKLSPEEVEQFEKSYRSKINTPHPSRRSVERRRTNRSTATARKKRSLSEQFVAVLRGNAEDYHHHRIGYEAFAKTQREVWSSIDRAGPRVHRDVLRRLRKTSRSTEKSASDWAGEMARLRDLRPRPLHKRYGRNPTPEQIERHRGEEREWSKLYRHATKMQKAQLAKDNAEFRRRA
jgi:hypothetical protein